MKQHQDREKLEAIVDYLDPHNKDINPLQRLIVNKLQKEVGEDGKENLKIDAILTPDMISLILQKIHIELLLDIRDTMYEISRGAGVARWGSKLGGSTTKVDHKHDPSSPLFEKQENIIPSTEAVEGNH